MEGDVSNEGSRSIARLGRHRIGEEQRDGEARICSESLRSSCRPSSIELLMLFACSLQTEEHCMLLVALPSVQRRSPLPSIGEQYYRENWHRSHELYPHVAAAEPEEAVPERSSYRAF
jgi:hypothetical protein